MRRSLIGFMIVSHVAEASSWRGGRYSRLTERFKALEGEKRQTPKAINELKDQQLKVRAASAWNACQDLLEAIQRWRDWVSTVRLQTLTEQSHSNSVGQTEPVKRLSECLQKGDNIAETGETAIRVLCALQVRNAAFQFDPDEPEADVPEPLRPATPLTWWPSPPSNSVDLTYYLNPMGEEQRHIDDQLLMMQEVLAPHVRQLARQLESFPESALRPLVDHSPDYRSVNWQGQPYYFTANQAKCVQVLWESWEKGAPDVGDATLLEAAESNSERLPLVFRGHPAWGTMIVDGSTKGTHRLAGEPPR